MKRKGDKEMPFLGMSDTPNTDQAVATRFIGEWVPADFARELERELAHARELLKSFYEDATSVHGIDTCRDETLLNRVQYYLEVRCAHP